MQLCKVFVQPEPRVFWQSLQGKHLRDRQSILLHDSSVSSVFNNDRQALIEGTDNFQMPGMLVAGHQVYGMCILQSYYKY